MKLLVALIALQALAPQEAGTPVLEFPEAGLDDPAAYEGYRTRFFQDARGNTVQVYLNQRTGRVVQLWANAANESVGFTARDSAGQPARLDWGSDGAVVQRADGGHSIEYRLRADAPLEIGWPLLGSMRIERDFQHNANAASSFDAPAFERPELIRMIEALERLEPAERRRHLELLRAASVEELRERLHPSLRLDGSGGVWLVRMDQPSFDGRNHLSLELSADRGEADVELRGRTVRIRPRSDRPVALTLRATTDAAALTPLSRGEIFNDQFLAAYERERAAADRVLQTPPGERTAADRDRLLAFRRLERQLRGMELLSSREKLMAGLPNFATYFGRDMLMTALMMEPIWRDAMAEHVVASVLRKLSPTGEVSHEEALGGQAIRERAPEYTALLADHFRLREAGDTAGAADALAPARAALADLQAVRENHGNMMDDDFQFPVLTARYLDDPEISPERKLAFLREPAREGGGESRLALLLRNLAYVARAAAPYAQEPVVGNLVSFPRREDGSWFPGSWRDSNAGYAGGRYAMDINVIWVPAALEAAERIVTALRALGIDRAELEALEPRISREPLGEYLRDPAALRRAVGLWKETERHFVVSLGAEEARERIRARLEAMPEEERSYWRGALRASGLPDGGIEFLALSLDAEGRPIPVVSTDPATHLALEPLAERSERVMRDVRSFLLPYPAGLFVPRLGPLVANDAYAPPAVWESFLRDHYHSPRVVWGREVNLVILALANQIRAAVGPDGEPRDPRLVPYVRELREALERTMAAVEASGLKHNELWSYRVENGRLLPVRYGSSTDVQLWNLTDLAVRYELARLPGGSASTPGF